MESIVISVAKDYTPTPGPRYRREGDWSGQQFREEIFIVKYREAQQQHKKLIVNLDGALGYGTSFLEEVFGGMIREYKEDYNQILNTIQIISREEDYLEKDVFEYLKNAYEKSTQARSRTVNS